MLRILIIIHLLFLQKIVYSQRSIFEIDTVTFVHSGYSIYVTDGESTLKEFSWNKDWEISKYHEKQYGKNVIFGKNDEYKVCYTIYIDSNKYVYWDLVELYSYGFQNSKTNNDDSYNNTMKDYIYVYMSEIEHNQEFDFFDEDDSPEIIRARTPPELRTYVPPFKTYLRNNQIEYEVINNGNLKKFFTLPISITDSTYRFPKFFSSGINAGFNHLKTDHIIDTVYYYPSLQMEIPCYKFVFKKMKYGEHFINYNLDFIEILIEKASLLPLRISMDRASQYGKIENGELKGFTNYYSQYIIEIQ